MTMTSPVEFLRPSSAATWVACSGYVSMRAQYPTAPEEADSEVCEDGTACHWLAAEVHARRNPPLNSLSPNQRVLDEDMFDAVDSYLTVVNSWPNVVPVLEQQIPCDVIYPGMRGTPDAWAYDPTTRTLYIADLKYGFRFVEVWENWQLIVYAAALIALLQIDGLGDQALTVKFHIVQPRCNHRDGPVRTWTVKGSDLRPYINELQHAAAAATREYPAPICTPNPGCTDCPARHACMALQNAALSALEVSYAGIPLELSPVAVGDELRRLKEALKRLEARVTGLEGQAEALLRSGHSVPWWSLEATYARERWRDGMESQVMTLGKYYHAELAKPPTPISPAQARKLLPPDIVAVYAHRPSTGVRLTKQDPYQAKKKFT